ncbi:hypothetical protein [Salinarimonas soli]|uniref:Uncharacterized protein n=1 Tax=Salinarimonas soli TaxID=1638099 RepID=A0A5B2VB88_9HYPH|nr:hypothetical protein [Salinarimonas soli]KAA2235998.1 hypothetical protein F0L46_17195 [Salinarimonas soli]
MLSLDAVESVCDQARTTLVIHPAIRHAVHGHEEAFYIGLRRFLKGETDGRHRVPLDTGGHLELRFSKRSSPGGYNILRVSPTSAEGLRRAKEAARG